MTTWQAEREANTFTPAPVETEGIIFREPTENERYAGESSKYLALANYLREHEDAWIENNDNLASSGITLGLKRLGVEVSTETRPNGFYVKRKSFTNTTMHGRNRSGIDYDAVAVDLHHQGWALVKCDSSVESHNLVNINGAMRTRGLKVSCKRRDDGFMVKLVGSR